MKHDVDIITNDHLTKHDVDTITNSLVKICLVNWSILSIDPTGHTGDKSGGR